MGHVFISYASKDSTAAEAVRDKLESKGIRCWIAPRDVPPGANWAVTIMNAIKNSSAMVLVYSSNANNSRQVFNEINAAADMERTIPIIPLRIEDVPLTEFFEFHIAKNQWLDAMTPPLEKHLDRLAQTMSAFMEIQPPEPSPPEPAPDPDPPGPTDVSEGGVRPPNIAPKVVTPPRASGTLCTRCGNSLTSTSLFCRSCGSPVPPTMGHPSETIAPEGKVPTSLVVWALICSAIALLFLPPVLGGIAIYLGFRARRYNQGTGTTLIAVGAAATVLGMVIAVLLIL